MIIAFVILAAFTYTSGLRAPAMIAVVKDVLIYITVIAAVIAVPMKLGGYSAVFAAIPKAKLLLATPPAGSMGSFSAYAIAGAGVGVRAVPLPALDHRHPEFSSARVVRRNAAICRPIHCCLGCWR